MGAGIAVVAYRSIGGWGIGTGARGWVTRAGVVALIQCAAHDRIAAGACAGITSIRLGTAIAVITHCAVGFDGIGAHAGRVIAGARVVALIESHADDGIAARARS